MERSWPSQWVQRFCPLGSPRHSLLTARNISITMFPFRLSLTQTRLFALHQATAERATSLSFSASPRDPMPDVPSSSDNKKTNAKILPWYYRNGGFPVKESTWIAEELNRDLSPAYATSNSFKFHFSIRKYLSLLKNIIFNRNKVQQKLLMKFPDLVGYALLNWRRCRPLPRFLILRCIYYIIYPNHGYLTFDG